MSQTAERDIIGRVREFWDRRPCNIRHSSRPVGTREYFDEVDARKYFVEPHILGFAQFERWQGKRVLEIGCGIGTDSINFVRAGADLTAVDLSAVSLEVCKQRFAVYGLPARFYCGNAEELSSFVPVEPYDLIYSFGVIHHTPHPERVITELAKYTHPGTEIRLMLYSKWAWKVLWIILKYGRGAFWQADDLVARYSEAETGCPITYYYSSGDIRRLLRSFQIQEMRKDHIFPYVIDKYIQYQYEWVWYLRWLERHFGWHTLIVAKVKEPALGGVKG